MKPTSQNSFAAFTLVETTITTGALGIMGLVIFLILNSGFILSAKNTALNVAHQQARTALMQMEQDLHSAVSLPQLVDASRTPISGQGPAPGISFQVFNKGLGNCRISANASANQKVVKIALNAGSPSPKVGQHLVIPTHQIEEDITAVSGGSNQVDVTLENNIPVPIVTNQSGTNYNVVCFFTDRISYVVANGQLNYYGSEGTNSYSVLGNDINSTLPFSTPNTQAGAAYYRFVVAINISTADPQYSNRNFKAANVILNGQVPMYARLTTYQ